MSIYIYICIWPYPCWLKRLKFVNVFVEVYLCFQHGCASSHPSFHCSSILLSRSKQSEVIIVSLYKRRQRVLEIKNEKTVSRLQFACLSSFAGVWQQIQWPRNRIGCVAIQRPVWRKSHCNDDGEQGNVNLPVFMKASWLMFTGCLSLIDEWLVYWLIT